MSNVFIAGATGYMGSRLAVELLRRGHAVFGLVGPGSEKRLPNGCRPIPGNALDRSSFVSKIAGTHTSDETAWGSMGKDARYLSKLRRVLGRADEEHRKLLLHMAQKMAHR